jgi:integrase/recombinase XerD
MPRIVPDEKLPRLREAWCRGPARFQLAFDLMLLAGLRLQEARALTWAQLWGPAGPYSTISLAASQAKYHRARDLPVVPDLAMSINRARLAARNIDNATPSPPALAPHPRRPAPSPRTLQRRLLAHGRAVGLERVTPHMLRHTFATRLLRKTNLRVVQTALGHRSLQTTQIYTHVTTDELRQAMLADPLML